MTPLQRVAMGLVIVFGIAMFPAHPTPSWESYDALADPVGWALVLLGTKDLAGRHPQLTGAHRAAVVAGLVSVPLWFPQLNHEVSGAGAWAVQVPQGLACLLLCVGIGRLAAEQEPRDAYAAKRFGLLTYGFAVVLVLPALVEGGGLSGLGPAADLVKLVVVVAAVWFLFRVHRRTWLGGPGPLEVPAAGPGRPRDE
ncbi:hypothetical protein GCM10011519_21340 [Marmoricola endophyticus]|uniref:Uncharacterized protein n=1 Tax=Marmoricola endophyticus TaxID=2040280 RepID=A0A917BLF4_9ACTN|nr:hypothetical protein [Marmoricola endophyticus]GGF47055.1 hypothetical protein GCM10011519_21340 [Marmoricola endophyticus]